MSNVDEMTEVLALVDKFCTVKQIRNLLRPNKDNKDVRIAAEDKEQLIQRNLRQAVDGKAIAISAVYDLIRAAEENGNQHIFYYKVQNKAIADALSFEAVANRLWGKTAAAVISGFPNSRLKPNDFQISDFRRILKRPDERDPKDWLLKVYGHSEIEKKTGEREERESGAFWIEYVKEPLRSVLVARWNNPNLLELRIQRDQSRKRVLAWLEELWIMLFPALEKGQFNQWELLKAMPKLVNEQEQNRAVYHFRDARVSAHNVLATFEHLSEDGNLFESTEARESLAGFLEEQDSSKGLTVTWHPVNGIPEKDTRIVLSPYTLPHEMVVPAHCSMGDLDYVTNQLRRFSR